MNIQGFIWSLPLMYGVYSVIGLGPALLFFRRYRSCFLFSLLISAALGFGLTVLVGCSLVFADLPVSRWALPWAGFMTGFSLSILWLFRKTLNLALPDRRWIGLYALMLVLLLVVLLLPVWAGGGLRYTVFRGNDYDTFDYLTMAEYIQREPYHDIRQPEQALVDRNPTYLWAQKFLGTQWGPAVPLSFAASMCSLSLVSHEYIFTILYLILISGPLTALGVFYRMNRWAVFLVSVATVSGFWAGFILDIRAEGHMTSLPVFFLFLFALALADEKLQKVKSTQPLFYSIRGFSFPFFPIKEMLSEGILLSILSTTLLLLYAELMTTLILGTLLLIGWRLVNGQYLKRHVLFFVCISIVNLLLTLPTKHQFLDWWRFQLSGLKTETFATWHDIFFPWLFNNPVTGLWGMTYFAKGYTTLGWMPRWVLEAVANAVGALCTVLFVIALVCALFRDRSSVQVHQRIPVSTVIPVFFILSTLVHVVVFLVQGQRWIAAKGLSYTILLVPLFLLQFYCSSSFSRTGKRGWGWGKSIVTGWLCLQVIIAFSRIPAAAQSLDYPFQKNIQRTYRRFDWDFRSIQGALAHGKGDRIWLCVDNDWAAWYSYFSLGWDRHIVDVNVIRVPIRPSVQAVQTDSPRFVSATKNAAAPFPSCPSPDYLLLRKTSLRLNPGIASDASNHDFCLVRVDDHPQKKPMILGIRDAEASTVDGRGRPSWRLGKYPLCIQLFSKDAGTYTLRFRVFRPSESTAVPPSVLSVRMGVTEKPAECLTTEGVASISLRVEKGFQEITLRRIVPTTNNPGVQKRGAVQQFCEISEISIE